MNLLIVESPAKAKTINKYLGKDYKVLASFGHVRDLPSKAGSVKPEDNFSLIYEIDAKSKKHLAEIASALKGCSKLILATDPDREGEAISWHVLEALRIQKKLPKNIIIERVVFNEITKSALKAAVANPREIDMDLVNAQQARRVLDYLVGFTLSPILWRKLPGSRSAGRVQSVALRLICEREQEIEEFDPKEYWNILANFVTKDNKNLNDAKLFSVNGQKIDKFFITNKTDAQKLESDIKEKSYQISSISAKTVKRNPQAPFTTSTLQQDAANKLGFGTKLTMQTAQKLYEGISIAGETRGLITYMRTDGVTISNEAINNIRNYIKSNFSDDYLPSTPNHYKSKIKNAQEAHEAIRPTDITLSPEAIKDDLSETQYKLYRLIWQRTVASQMAPQESLQTTIEIFSDDNHYGFKLTGSIIKFKGFTAIYNFNDNKSDNILPAVAEKEAVDMKDLSAKQHFTEPPPRYNEASLVKKLEEIGIGRPSTYAAIISILLDRNYVYLETKRFYPEERGMIVTAFLVKFFAQYFEYDFTANLEAGLDNVSNGNREWKNFLDEFWSGFNQISSTVMETNPQDISQKITDSLEKHYFTNESGDIERKCTECSDGSLNLRIGKFGAFIACTNYPSCKYTRQITGEASEIKNDIVIGTNDLGQEILLKKGPYGHYIEVSDSSQQVKRVSIPKFINIDDIDLDLALKIISLPRNLGINPNNDQEVIVNNGKFGPYIVNDKKFHSINNEDLFTIELNRALAVIAESSNKATKGTIKSLGKHPDKGDEINVMKGRYGPYLKMGKMNIAIPKKINHETITLEEALELIAKKLK